MLARKALSSFGAAGSQSQPPHTDTSFWSRAIGYPAPLNRLTDAARGGGGAGRPAAAATSAGVIAIAVAVCRAPVRAGAATCPYRDAMIDRDTARARALFVVVARQPRHSCAAGGVRWWLCFVPKNQIHTRLQPFTPAHLFLSTGDRSPKTEDTAAGGAQSKMLGGLARRGGGAAAMLRRTARPTMLARTMVSEVSLPLSDAAAPFFAPAPAEPGRAAATARSAERKKAAITKSPSVPAC
jgi:hypothetical protein